MTILIVSNTNDPTADYVQEKMDYKGISHIRFNTDQMLKTMKHTFRQSPSLSINGKRVNLDDIVGIWYRRPEPANIPEQITSQQARQHIEVEAYYYLKCLWRLLEDKNWVSHPWAISWANVKLHQLKAAQMTGLSTPKSLATNDPAEAKQFIKELDAPVIVKPFKNNVLTYNDQTAVIYTSQVTENSLEKLSSVKYSITFFQEKVKKEVDVRVTVIGNKVFAAETLSQSDPNTKIDWRRSSPHPKKWKRHNLPNEIAQKCVALKNRYQLNFAAIDFAKTPQGKYVFFELNPNGQWAWKEIQLNLPMSSALIKTLTQGGEPEP